MLNTIKTTIRKFVRKNQEILGNIHIASKMASLVALLVIIPLGVDKPNSYQTEIKLNDKSAEPLVLADKTVNAISVPSRDQINEATYGLDPEAIKALIQEIGAEYNVDWRLVYAIGAYESGNYSSHLARSQFNFFGRKASSSAWASWDNPEDAIRNQYDYLQTRYFDRGLDTPSEIGPIYCEGNTWAGKINSIMSTL